MTEYGQKIKDLLTEYGLTNLHSFIIDNGRNVFMPGEGVDHIRMYVDWTAETIVEIVDDVENDLIVGPRKTITTVVPFDHIQSLMFKTVNGDAYIAKALADPVRYYVFK